MCTVSSMFMILVTTHVYLSLMPVLNRKPCHILLQDMRPVNKSGHILMAHIPACQAMIGENRQLITNEPVEFKK